MLHRGLALALLTAAGVAAFPPQAEGQAAGSQLFGVCASQPALPVVYVSGVLQGTAASVAGLRAGFTQFLAQRYGYKGAVVCAPAANAALAEKLLQMQTAAARNAKRNVIETGWVGNPAPAVALAGMLPMPSAASQGAAAAPAATPAAGGASTASANASGGSGSSGGSGLASVLASIFGSGCGGGTAAGGTAAKSAAAAPGDASKSSDTGSGCQSALTQVSSALSSTLAQKSASAGAAADSGSAHKAADGLGSAQAQNTRLVVYGCGRQDTQIACVSELTNQNQADTLMQSAELWKDTFVVDDRGDRHPRSRGFFLNIDGEQRTQLDVSYGKSARFILVFDDVQPRVQKVTLRSKSGGLDVEDIELITTGTAAAPAE